MRALHFPQLPRLKNLSLYLTVFATIRAVLYPDHDPEKRRAGEAASYRDGPRKMRYGRRNKQINM